MRGKPVRVPVPPPLPQAAAIARALRPFTRPWRQGTATQLDIDATVDRYAEHRVLTPVLRTAPERWFDVAVVVDDAPTMAVWHDTIAEFVRMLARTGFFRAVHRWSLTDAVVKDHLGRAVPLADAAAMARVPHARRLILIVSDFASAAWREPAPWKLVTAWARATPAALVNPLPVRFWAHSGMDLPAVRAKAVGPPGPTSALSFRVPLRARLAGDSWLPVPALPITPAAVDRWARTIIRTDPDGCDALLVPAHRAAPPPAPAGPSLAAEAFLHTAAAPAARLALLSASFEHFSLSLLRLLHANAVPEAEPADLAELLISGLATIDDPRAANPVLTYHPAARDYLLDHVTTDDLWTAHHALTSFIAAHPDVTQSMLALAHTPTGQEALPAELRPFAAATTDTLRLLGVLSNQPTAPSDTTVLTAPGNHAHPAERRDKAVDVTKQPLTRYRILNQRVPGYLPDLAGALSDHNVQSGDARRRDKAEDLLEEAVVRYRILNQQIPGYLPYLAGALSDLGVRYSTVGRRNEAMALLEEAVTRYRILAKQNPGHLPDLAMAMNNLGICYGAAGRLDEAVELTEQALTQYRDLAVQNPDHLPNLAMTYSNLGNRLSAVGRRDEAVKSTEAAVARYRVLAEQNPGYLPNLAIAMSNLSVRYGEVRQRHEAVDLTEQALIQYRILAQQDPGYLPDLAGALSALSVHYGTVERRDQAVAAIDEAVDTYRKLVKQRPDAYAPDLATSLTHFAACLSALQRPTEGLTAIDEAVVAYRQLVKQRADAYLPDLAMNLNNRAHLLNLLGHHTEGLVAIDEAINIYRRLVQQRPDAYLANLATSLNNRAHLLNLLGHHTEGLTTADEAAEILRQLDQQNAASTYDIAVSFAAEQRDYVDQFVEACKARGISVFYDRDLTNEWREKDFIHELGKVNGKTVRYFMPFISNEYLTQPISRDGLRAAMRAAFNQGDGHVLPVLLGRVEVPTDLLSPAIAYVNAEDYTPEQLADVTAQRIRVSGQQSTRDVGKIAKEAFQFRMPHVAPQNFSSSRELEITYDYLADQLQGAVHQLESVGFIATVHQGASKITVRIEHQSRPVYGLDIHKSSSFGDNSLNFVIGTRRTGSGGNSSNGYATPYFDLEAQIPKLKMMDFSVFSSIGSSDRTYTKEEFFTALWDRIVEQLQR